MKRCTKCTANLPDGARFCMECGNRIDESPEMNQPGPAPAPVKLDFIQPALAGGMALGLLSSIPLIQIGNCLCCMWVVAGGALAALVLVRQDPPRVNLGDGAFVGVLAGLVGALVATAVSIPIRMIAARTLTDQREALEKALSDIPGLDEAIRELVLSLSSPQITVFTVVVTFLANLLVFALFAMLGGILAVAIAKREK